jgi:hypothetical protein
MKTISLILLHLAAFFHLTAQQKDFEGTISYKIRLESKKAGFDENLYKLLLAGNGDKLTVQIKDGNYRQSVGVVETYFIQKAKRVYFRFKNIDTLYFRDYGSDTNRVTGIIKSDSLIRINKYSCKSIKLQRKNSSSLFYYTNEFHLDPKYDEDNTIDNLNVFAKESNGGVWLYSQTEIMGVKLIDSCIKIEQRPIDMHVFDLPALPQRDILTTSLVVPPRFPGKENAWGNYLKNNLNTSLAIKYVKLAKGQDTASEKVLVSFDVLEDGSLSNIQAINKKEVHPKLAEEAVRVVKESLRWLPATIYGVKTKFTVNQPVVFAVSR